MLFSLVEVDAFVCLGFSSTIILWDRGLFSSSLKVGASSGKDMA